MSPSGEKNDDMATPSGAAPNHHRRTRTTLLANVLSALVIGGILAIGAASVWYMLGRTDLPVLIADSDNAWAGMMTDEYLAALRESQPLIRSSFDVYLVEGRRYASLIYVKEQCTRDDVAGWFFVHVAPMSPDYLPDHRKPHGFDNLDFRFEQHGARLGETCWADLPLPSYEIAAIRTGRYVEEEGVFRTIWEERVVFQVDGMAVDEYLGALGERRPAIRSDFDVHLVEDRLVYVKEQCARDDVDGRFFVEVVPASPDALPDDRKPHGFDNLDFRFEQHGARRGETCWAALPLPGYEIGALRTGRYVEEEGVYRTIWEERVVFQVDGMAVDEYLGALGERQPAIRSDFDVHLVEDRLGRTDLPVLIADSDNAWAGMMTDEYLAALRESQPLIRSSFDVYFVEGRRYASLIYVKEQCTRDDVAGWFFVHVAPMSPDYLPDHRKPHGFDNLDFRFEQHGARLGETCWADLPLPSYEITAIRTGRYVEEEGVYRTIWEERVVFQVDGMAVDEYLGALGERRPAIRSDFDVHLVEDRLVYVKEQCTRDDVDGWFFVHLVPVSPDYLPDDRKPHGFDNLDFRFEQHGARHGETCWAALPLPGYEIAAIRTGRYVEEEGVYRTIWEERVVFQVDGMAVDEYLGALGERRPAIRSDFDVHLVEDRLVYVKEQCVRADVDGWFFVEVVPASPDALPDDHKPHGFENLDFSFERHGARLGEACWAALPLPGYEIGALRTGRYVEEEGVYRTIWEERVVFQVDGMAVDEYLGALGERRPAIRSDFDVHLVEDRLVYVKEQCARADVDGWFFVEVVPASPDALPGDRKPHGFENLDFSFEQHGARLGEACWAALPLPGYEIAAIRTGRYVEEEGVLRTIWEERVVFQVDGMAVDEYLGALGERRPAIRSDFDVHLVEDRLVYVKEQCARADVDGWFFVEVVPASPDALPDDRKPYGFENLDFSFERHGARHGETCWAALPLPGYEIGAVRTGRYVEEEGVLRTIWEERVVFQVDGMTVDEYLGALGERRPAIRSDFDVHLVEDRLVYVKEQCARADVDGWFFVEVVPASPDALRRRPARTAPSRRPDGLRRGAHRSRNGWPGGVLLFPTITSRMASRTSTSASSGMAQDSERRVGRPSLSRATRSAIPSTWKTTRSSQMVR